MNSLDPRVNRLPPIGNEAIMLPKNQLDQFGTFEVFVQPKEEKPFQHEGIVHAPNLEMAYILAKEAFTRRFTCTSLYVTDTRNVHACGTTEGEQSAYDTIPSAQPKDFSKTFEIYHLLKRGKQHIQVGTVQASTPEEALSLAKEKFNQGKIVYNVWAIDTNTIRYTTEEEKDYWHTLPDKKFRDAAHYKAGEKLSKFNT